MWKIQTTAPIRPLILILLWCLVLRCFDGSPQPNDDIGYKQASDQNNVVSRCRTTKFPMQNRRTYRSIVHNRVLFEKKKDLKMRIIISFISQLPKFCHEIHFNYWYIVFITLSLKLALIVLCPLENKFKILTQNVIVNYRLHAKDYGTFIIHRDKSKMNEVISSVIT